MPANWISSTDALIVFRGITPCIAIVYLGYWTGRVDRAEHEKTLSSLIYYVFSPCLIFSGLQKHSFTYAEIGALALAALLVVLLLYPLALLPAKGLSADRGVMLPMLFTSTGTLLLPLAYLLYGNHGLGKGVMFHLLTSFLFNTLGLRIAGGRMEPLRFLRSPSAVAALIALLSVELQIPLSPEIEGFFRLVERGVDMIGTGAVPVLLLSFGYPLSGVSLPSMKKGVAGAAVRMVLGPLAAILIILLLRKTGLLTMVKGYNLLSYIDQRTTEAIIMLASALPGAISCYLVNSRHSREAADDALGTLMVSSLLGILTVPGTVFLINRFILAG